MAEPKDRKLSLRLSGGAVNRTLAEFVAPAPVQGSEPKLVASVNTRLSKTPGGVARSPRVRQLSYDASVRRYGLVPSTSGKRTTLTQAAVVGGLTPNWSVVGDGAALPTTVGLNAESSRYDYAQPAVLGTISRSGNVGGDIAISPVAQAFDTRYPMIWKAFWSIDGNSASVNSTPKLTIVAEYEDGRQYSTFMTGDFAYNAGPGSTLVAPWVGLTTHPTAGVYLWFRTSAHGVSYARVFLQTATYFLSFGPRVTVDASPGVPGVVPDVVADGETAYVMYSPTGSTTDAVIRHYDMATATVLHSATMSGALTGGGYCALHVASAFSGGRVCAAASRPSTRQTSIGLFSTTLTTVYSPVTVDGGGPISVQRTDSPQRFMLFISEATHRFSTDPIMRNDIPTSPFVGTKLYSFPNSGPWAHAGMSALSFLRLHSRGTVWAGEGANVGPLMFFVRVYGPQTVLPGDVDYCDDPAILAVYFPNDPSVAGVGLPPPVARFACVRGGAAPVMAYANDSFASSSDFSVGNKIHCAWREITNYTTQPYGGRGRYTVIDLSVQPLSVLQDRDGSGLVAGAMPSVYDGAEVFSMGAPVWSPHLTAVSFGGAVLPAGAYLIVAYQEWADASGTVHRTRPSNVVSFTANGANGAALYITTPYIRLWNASRVKTRVYVSATNGKTAHLIEEMSGITYDGVFPFLYINAKVGDVGDPQIYSTSSEGEEITPQPPPPLRDLAIVGARAVGIDAEFPARLPFSKLRVAGIGYEWFPAGESYLPSGAGEGMACREWQGVWLVFAQGGVFQISGDGPNNTGTAGAFYPPVKISDIGCSNTASVVEYPGGIMWQSGNRFARVSGAGIVYDLDFGCTHDVSSAVCVPSAEEVQLFSATLPEIRVYNYALDRWTTWDSETHANLVTIARQLPWDTDKVLLLSDASRTLHVVDSNSVSSAAHMTFRTGPILLDGDFQSHMILREIVYSAAIAGPHGLEISVFADYEASPSTTQAWSAADLASIAINGRYTVRKEVIQPNGRAFEVMLRDVVAPGEVNSAGMSPRAVTLVFAREDGTLFEEVFNATSYK